MVSMTIEQLAEIMIRVATESFRPVIAGTASEVEWDAFVERGTAKAFLLKMLPESQLLLEMEGIEREAMSQMLPPAPVIADILKNHPMYADLFRSSLLQAVIETAGRKK